MSRLCSPYLRDAIVTPTGIGQRAFHNKSMSLEELEGVLGQPAQSSSISRVFQAAYFITFSTSCGDFLPLISPHQREMCAAQAWRIGFIYLFPI